MNKHAYYLDLFVVLVFAAAGRASHSLSDSVLGVLETAWPFLIGVLVGWVAVLRQDRHVWWLDGVLIAMSTIVVGMLLRLATGEGTALAFVLVASGVLVAGLVGWRAVAAAFAARQHKSLT
ncbi:MAG: DUF3054 domain-containing protein [Ornithinimicrobium sp.]|uniref:DUF3054 domain-containing protein n=1 Tax=Ornithinimicrobium sp. TaxID=1977084 RepID=UPI0026DFF564|nr:DUF3054 domain-containing protein [Ornithinimicrobium sp.]MDO5738583.1 DUF3054 domain-containing protein [Ornithinimicrobium sp.]